MVRLPKFRELVFKQNQNRPDIYDLTDSGFKGFAFIRLSNPRADFLIRQGARYVLESWKHGEKPLFTGLRPLKGSFYHGDHLKAGKRALLLVRIIPGEVVIYLFGSYPRGMRLQNILHRFPETRNPGNHPGAYLSPTEPATGPIDTTKINHSGK